MRRRYQDVTYAFQVRLCVRCASGLYPRSNMRGFGSLAARRNGGASDEQVPVLVLRGRSGATADAVLESLKVSEFYRILTPVIARDEDTVLVSD
ncbi:MAG: hypothetical protein ACLPJW_11475, partial [Rhodomicrobium sp.]